MEDVMNKVEALLFSSGKKMSVGEIAKLCRSDVATVALQLQQLKSDYESKRSSLLLIEEGDGWKLTVREQYAPVARRVVAETELTKTLMETLAVIAWKAPVLQSELIRIRTNKAYDHIAELESSGFISREKHGRTKLIRLTERFFRYFDVRTEQEVKEKFKVADSRQSTLPVVVEPSPVPSPVSEAGAGASSGNSAN